MYKKKISSLLAAVIVAGMVTGSMPVCVNAQETTGNAGTTYYVDAENGDDSNSGTSIDAPWKSLNKVTDTTFLPGDQILLKSGSVWNGEWLWPKGSGVEGAPIIIDKYGGEEKPIINGMGIDRGLNYSGAVHLRNQEYWEIRNLEITNDDDFDEDIDLSRPKGDNSWSSKNMTRNGILLIVDCDQLEDDDDGIMDHIYIENCYVHDVDGPNDWNDTFTGGIIFNVVGSSLRPSSSFNDLRIAYNTIRKVDLLGVTGYVTTVKSTFMTVSAMVWSMTFPFSSIFMIQLNARRFSPAFSEQIPFDSLCGSIGITRSTRYTDVPLLSASTSSALLSCT